MGLDTAIGVSILMRPRTLTALFRLSIVSSVIAAQCRAPASSPKPAFPLVQGNTFSAEALAVPSAAFHNETGRLVCRLLAGLTIGAAILSIHPHADRSSLRPSFLSATLMALPLRRRKVSAEAQPYVGYVADVVNRQKSVARQQLRKMTSEWIEHETEPTESAESHLVSGGRDLWIHSHLSMHENGTLIRSERDGLGMWRPAELLIEYDDRRVLHPDKGPRFFFPVDSLTKDLQRPAVVLPQERFMYPFQPLLERWLNSDAALRVDYALARGITPGTGNTWIMASNGQFDAQTGTFIDPHRGFLFLRADQDRTKFTVWNELLTILRYWANTIRSVNPQQPIDRQFLLRFLENVSGGFTIQDLSSLDVWLNTLRYSSATELTGVSSYSLVRFIQNDEITYMKSLVDDVRRLNLPTSRAVRPFSTSAA